MASASSTNLAPSYEWELPARDYAHSSNAEFWRSALCDVCRAIFTGPLRRQMPATPGQHSLNQNVQNLRASAKACHLCHLRWDQLSAQEQAQFSCCTEINYFFWGNDAVSGLVFEYKLPEQTIQREFKLVVDKEQSPVLGSLTATNDASLSWVIAKWWLSNCMINHPMCHRSTIQTERRLPTRLIDLGPGSTIKPRLCITTTFDPTTEYMTLSHRWGKHKFMTLTVAMLAEMQQRIEVSRLTKTFREAMEVTKRLGVRYIWIDSLCIIQDSELGVDWEYESKLMGNVYRHSSCNIAATKSLDGSGGCFTTRHVFDVRPCVVDASWTGSPGTKYTCDSSTQMTHDLKDSMLLNRAWVVQETILAPRTLHFGQHQMYWECLQLTTCETAPARRRFYANKLSLLHESWQNQPLAMFNVADPAFIDYHIWGQVVTKFSHGGLTYPEKDKLIAISSIAKSLAIAAHDSYLAGLWCKPLAQQLRWVCNSVPGQPCLRPETYRAPSWSWASIDGPIIHPSYPYKEQDSAVRIGDARVVPAKMGGDPFGPVVAGYIRLVGTLVKLVYKRASEFEGQGWLGGARCGLIPDEKKFVENTVLCCLPLELGAESVIGLVIELARTARRGEYVRRGYFAVLYNNASTDVLEFKRRFMDACKNKDVRKEVTAADYEALEDDTRDGFPRYRISLV